MVRAIVPVLIIFNQTQTPTLPLARATRTPTADVCVGDLNHDGQVTIEELVRAVGSAVSGCP